MNDLAKILDSDVQLNNAEHDALVQWFNSFETKEQYRTGLAEVEKRMLEMPQSTVRIEHTLLDGMYVRTMFVSRGTLAMGKLHAHDCILIIPKGDVTVVSEDGVKRITGYYQTISMAGAKRLAIVHADTVWMNIVRAESTDISEIEKMFTAKDYGDIEIGG